jgi:hypothetical protein
VKAALDVAEEELDRCLNILMAPDKRRPADILSLQPLLLKALTDAEGLYREIVQERKRLISRKSSYAAAWFRNRMSKLDHYAKCMKIVLGAARAIGDGFAWIFLQKRGRSYRAAPEISASANASAGSWRSRRACVS